MRNRARPRKTKKNLTSYAAEMKASTLHQQIIAFEDYTTHILPAIKQDLKAGLTPKQLREKYAALVQARTISDAILTQNEGHAASVSKDILDRVEGKATEKKEVTHRFSEMSDKELDAVLKSEEEELKAMEERFEQ